MAPSDSAGGEPPRKKARGNQPTGAALSRRVVLVGMRAAGKSSFGRAAATHCQCPFLDLDEVLEREVFKCKIPAFLDQHGWPKFREAEAKLLEDVVIHGKYLERPEAGCIIATGGGVIETPTALELLKKHSPVIWVDRHIDDIVETLEGVGSYRPALGSSPREIYERRVKLYPVCSDYVFAMQRGDCRWELLTSRFVHLTRWADSDGASLALANTVAVPIVAADATSACADVKEAASEGAGLVEFRVDKIAGGPDAVLEALPQLLSAARRVGLPGLVTFRPTWEDPNAGYSGEEELRFKVLRSAAEFGAAFIDVEKKAMPAFLKSGGLPAGAPTKLVVSSHDFQRLWPLDELRAHVAEMRELAGPTGIVKVAQMGQASDAAARMLTLLAEAKERDTTLAMGMGEVGVFTRLLAPFLGAAWTFGCLSGRASAPGQVTVAEMLGHYRLGSATSSTKVYGVLDEAALQSRLPSILNAGFAADALDACCVPLLLRGCTLKALLDAMPSCLAGICIGDAHRAETFELAEGGDELSSTRRAADFLVQVPTEGEGRASFMAKSTDKADGDDTLARALAAYAVFRGGAAPSDAARSAMVAAAA